MSIPSCSVQVRRIPMWRPTDQTRAAVGFVCVFNGWFVCLYTSAALALARWRNLPVFWSAETVLISFNLGWRRPCCRWMLHDRLHWTPVYSFEYIVQRCTRDISREHHEMPPKFCLIFVAVFVVFRAVLPHTRVRIVSSDCFLFFFFFYLTFNYGRLCGVFISNQFTLSCSGQTEQCLVTIRPRLRPLSNRLGSFYPILTCTE